jgi:hypothetical protein
VSIFIIDSFSFSLFSKYIADNRLENNPWHGVDEWALKVKRTRKQEFVMRRKNF